MAAQSKTRWSQLRVGLMAIVALGILFFLIFLLAGSTGLFKTKVPLYTYLADSVALAPGSPVRLNGILVGKVGVVELSGLADPKRIVRVSLDVDDSFLSSIPTDSQALIASENLLGTKYINIKKGMKKDAIKPGAEVPSGETAELEDLFQQGNTTISAMQITLARLDKIIAQVESGQGTIGKVLYDDTLYTKVLDIATEAQKLTKTMNNGEGTVGKLFLKDDLYNDFRNSLAKVDKLIDGLEQGNGTLGKLLKDTALHDELKATLADTRKLINQINNDQGTVGKLLKSDELHKQLSDSLNRMDVILDKINSGQGTLGQLLVNPQLYETLDGSTNELRSLLKDFRANPKKFLTIRLNLF
jgi:phospholipid/cholesterol/gamma-HCH transport system substrate-binding protein